MAGIPRKRRGNIFIISAPSGAGKSTLCNRLMNSVPSVRPSVSYTTRLPREGEINNVHYTFVKAKKFREMIAAGDFVEWAEVHGNLYGTSRKRLDALVRSGSDVILDIDVQGAGQIRKTLKGGVYVFIMPPSLAVLKKRLEKRMSGTKENPEDIKQRLKKASDEMKHAKNYDYVIVNDQLGPASKQFEAVFIAERVRNRAGR